MPMGEHKIRFGASAWKAIQEEAVREGVRPAVFVREAAIAYAVWLRARRTGDGESEDQMTARLRELRKLDR
jgi:hypothetical protein